MELIVLWIGLAVVTMIAATSRGRSGGAWLLIGLATGALGLIAVLVMPRIEAEQPRVDTSRPPTPSPTGRGSAPESRAHIPRYSAVGDGEYDQEVVGESHHQSAIASHVTRRDADGVRIPVDAILVPDADSPHDPNAVAVQIGSQKVGHLPREDAEIWIGMLEREGLRGQPVRTKGVVVGGQDIERRGVMVAAPYGIWLDIAPGYDLRDLRQM